jgi:hypothetical protein
VKDASARPKRINRLLALMPSLCLTAGWVGIWALWPGPAAMGARVPSRSVLSTCRMAEGDGVYRKPDLFGPPSSMGFSPPRRDADNWQAPHARRSMPPVLLTREATGPEGVDAGRPWTLPEAAAAPDYLRDLTERPVFGLPATPETGVRAWLSPALEKAGYTWPQAEVPSNGLPGAWNLEMPVEVDGRGRTRDVFVTRGSGYGAVDRRIEGLLMRGAAAHATPGGVYGTVNISAGR